MPIPGFLILAAKKTIRSIADFSDEEAREFASLLKTTRQAMSAALGIKEVYLFQNEDSQHHFHLWLFPRYPWMERFGRKIQSVRVIMDHAEKNMRTEEIRAEVKEAARKMKVFFKNYKINK